MIAFANILLGIGRVLDMALTIMLVLVIARAVISWVNPDPYNVIVRFLVASTDPFLRPLRRYIPLVGGGIDLTPIVLLIVIYFLKIALAQTIIDYGFELRRQALHYPRPALHENINREILPVL